MSYSIRNWDINYEVSDKNAPWKPGDARRTGPLPYVRLRTGARDWPPSYRDLVAATTPSKLPMVFGVFCMLLELSAVLEGEQRGQLLDRDGKPATAESLSRATGFLTRDINYALEVLSSQAVRWLTNGSVPESPGSPGKDGPCAPAPARTDQYKTDQYKTNHNTGLSPFEHWWRIYPRKTGKQAALKAWNKIAPSKEQARVMYLAAQEQAVWPQWTKDNGQFIPLPTTWLSQGRWEDELPTPSSKPDDTVVENEETRRKRREQWDLEAEKEKERGAPRENTGAPHALGDVLGAFAPATARESQEGEA